MFTLMLQKTSILSLFYWNVMEFLGQNSWNVMENGPKMSWNVMEIQSNISVQTLFKPGDRYSKTTKKARAKHMI